MVAGELQRGAQVRALRQPVCHLIQPGILTQRWSGAVPAIATDVADRVHRVDHISASPGGSESGEQQSQPYVATLAPVSHC